MEVNSTVSQAMFAVHKGRCFSCELGTIDLSEMYHDAVATLRMETKWATETLDFWNQ